MGDLRDVYERYIASLEKSIPKMDLSPEQKKILSDVLEFGYVAAFCERTCDMNDSFFQAQRYKDGFESIKKLLK